MRILVITSEHQYAINLAKEVAKVLKYRSLTSIEEHITLLYGSERLKNITLEALKKIYKEIETLHINKVVVANGVIRYILLKYVYYKRLRKAEFRLLKEVYSTYDYVVFIVPKMVKTDHRGIFKGLNEDITGASMIVLGGLDPTKLILDYNIASKIKTRAKRIARIIARKEQTRLEKERQNVHSD